MVTSYGVSPTTGFSDVVIRVNPSDLPQLVSSCNLDFHTTSATEQLGVPQAATNPLFSGAPDNFSLNAQTSRSAQDAFPESVSLVDGAGLIRVPFQLPAGASGAFPLVFGTFNQQPDATATLLSLIFTDTGSITVNSSFLPGDYNHNGTVGPEDYALWKVTFGLTNNLAADGNSNNIVDAADYVVWCEHLPLGSAAVAVVPEPGPLLLAAFGLLMQRTIAVDLISMKF